MKKRNTPVSFLCHWFREKRKSVIIVFASFFILASIFFFLLFLFYIYVPLNPYSQEKIVFTVYKGWGDEEVARNLKAAGIIRSDYFFRIYTLLSLKHHLLKAGTYELSPRMSVYQIVDKMKKGEVIKNKITILEGWDLKKIGAYLESKNICSNQEFFSIVQKNFLNDFDFLKDKPPDADLEGYLFPDTYEIVEGEGCEKIIRRMLSNFDQKLTPELREEINKQGKTIFEIIIMASILEKEAKREEDKRIISGILWKRIQANMPLQVDATVNYITGKNLPAISLQDKEIDSPYNTYKYKNLPKGPISTPSLESIKAAIYPKESHFWYYLSTPEGEIIFSKTFEEHKIAKQKYLR